MSVGAGTRVVVEGWTQDASVNESQEARDVMRSVTPTTNDKVRGAARASGAETVPAGQDLSALGRRVLAGASAAAAVHMVRRAQAITDDARSIAVSHPIGWDGGEAAP